MFPALRAAALAACLYCAPTQALHVDKLHNNDLLNQGTLTISLQGACQLELTLANVGLYTYNPLDHFSEGLWLAGQASNGTAIANYYNLVLVDEHLNVVAAYAPARLHAGDIIDNGIHVQQYDEQSTTDGFKSVFSLTAAQDTQGALDALLDYVSQHYAQDFQCAAISEGAYLTTLNEAQSSVSVHDTTVETADRLRAKTQLSAHSVAAIASEQLQNHDDGSYQLSRQFQPITIDIRFTANKNIAF